VQLTKGGAPMSERVIIAGNMIVDVIKTIDTYPAMGMLANISDVSRAVGGCAPNTGIDLAKIDPTIPISLVGQVGDDDYGRYLLSEIAKYGINTDGIRVSADRPTSFSDAMSLPSGERTFFHARGANKTFCPEMVDLDKLDAGLLHIGYILLLDAFDQADEECGTVMARFLRDVQRRGIKTSVDVVSDSSADYPDKIIPALRYCNYAIMNEIESTAIWGLSAYREDGSLHIDNIRETMKRMTACGVKDKIIIHAKDAAFCCDAESGEFTAVPSLCIPPEDIKGSVGAGDAFCAGSLYGLRQGWSDREILEFASAAAACNLASENSVDGMRCAAEIHAVAAKYPRKTLQKG